MISLKAIMEYLFSDSPVTVDHESRSQAQMRKIRSNDLPIFRSTAESLQYIKWQCELLADLSEAHFTHNLEETQQILIIQTSRLIADELEKRGLTPSNKSLLVSSLQDLTTAFQHIKSKKLQTEGGNDWSSVMQPIVESIHHAFKAAHYTQQSPKAEQPERNSISFTYMTAQRRLLNQAIL